MGAVLATSLSTRLGLCVRSAMLNFPLDEARAFPFACEPNELVNFWLHSCRISESI